MHLEKMKRIFFCLILICKTFSSAAAQQTDSHDFTDTISSGGISVNISPLCMLDAYNGSAYRLGLQIKPLKFISLGADAGSYFDFLSEKVSVFYNMKGYHVRFRMAYYPKNIQNFSFGLEYQFKQQSFSYFDSTLTEPAFEAFVNKKVYGYALFAAYDYHFSNRFYVDFQFGTGFRYREIFNTRSDVVGNTSLAWPWDSMNTGRVKNGHNYIPNFTLAARFSYSVCK